MKYKVSEEGIVQLAALSKAIKDCEQSAIESVNSLRRVSAEYTEESLVHCNDVEDLIQEIKKDIDEMSPLLEEICTSLESLAATYVEIIEMKLIDVESSGYFGSTGSSEGRHIEKIDGIKYYYDDNGEAYRVGDTLLSDISYTSNGYTYTTDGEGRITSASGKMHLKNGSRDNITDSMKNIGLGYEMTGDDRGHLFADIFGGSGGMENLIPQNFHLNRGAYKTFENMIADALDHQKEVIGHINVIYGDDGSKRPKALLYTAEIDGVKVRQFFLNESGE